MSKAFDQVGVMHASLATTSTTNSECREVREKAEEELGAKLTRAKVIA